MNFFYPFDGGRDAIWITLRSSSRPRIRGPFILAVGGSKVRAGTTGMTGVLSEPGMRLKTATTAGDDQAVDAVRAGVENWRHALGDRQPVLEGRRDGGVADAVRAGKSPH